MSALTSTRKGSTRIVNRDKRPLAATAKPWKGAIAFAILSGPSAGFYTQALSSAIGIAVGRFTQSADNTSGADGDKTCEIDFSFRSSAGRKLYLVDNDIGNPVVAADREGICYILDDHTVSMTVVSALGGVVYDVTAEGVWVEMATAAGEESAAGLSNVAPVNPSSTAASAGAAGLAARQDHKHQIALATPAAEGLMSGAYAGAFHAPVANHAGLKAIAAAGRANGMICMVLAGLAGTPELWQFNATSVAVEATENLVVTPTSGAGMWLRIDAQVTLFLPVTFAKADNSALFTNPAGARLKVREAWYDVLTTWAGGAASAVGVHATPAGWTTKGDILGGAAGDIAATLTAPATGMVGTIGAKLDTLAHGRLLLEPGDAFNWDRITSAFTSGTANVRVLCDLVANAGA